MVKSVRTGMHVFNMKNSNTSTKECKYSFRKICNHLGTLCLSKAHIIPLCLYKRPSSVPVLTEKSPKRTFKFAKKAKKTKQRSVCLAASTCKGSAAQSSERPHLAFSQKPCSAAHHQAAMALNCACEHLCFISQLILCIP